MKIAHISYAHNRALGFWRNYKKRYIKTFFIKFGISTNHIRILTLCHTEFFHPNKSINDVEIVNLAFSEDFSDFQCAYTENVFDSVI